MLDLIFSSRMYDIGQMYGWGNAESFYHTLVSGNNNITSFWEKNEIRIKNAMEKTINQIIELDR